MIKFHQLYTCSFFGPNCVDTFNSQNTKKLQTNDCQYSKIIPTFHEYFSVPNCHEIFILYTAQIT